MASKFSRLVVNNAKWIIVTWVILALIFGYFGTAINSYVQEMNYDVEKNTESSIAEEIIQEEFPKKVFTSYYMILYESSKGDILTNPEWKNMIDKVVRDLNNEIVSKKPDIYENVISYWTLLEDPDNAAYARTLISKDNTTTYLILGTTTGTTTDIWDDTEKVQEISRRYINDVTTLKTVAVTGRPAMLHDSIEIAEENLHQSDIIAIAVVSVILLVVFGSLIGLSIPLGAMILALAFSFGLTTLLASAGWISIYDTTSGVMSMIGIAVSVDYNLLSVTRFREELKGNGKSKKEAAMTTIDTAGMAVLFSGLSVMFGFGTLVVLDHEMAYTTAYTIILVVLFAIITAIVFVPAVLSLIGTYIDWPEKVSKFFTSLTGFGAISEKETEKKDTWWKKWNRIVMNNPWKFIILILVFVAPFLYASMDLKLGMPGVETLPADTESRIGFEILEEKFSSGEMAPVNIVIKTNVTNGVFNESFVDKLKDFTDWLLQSDDVESFVAVTGFKSEGVGATWGYSTVQDLLNNQSVGQLTPELFHQILSRTVDLQDNNDTTLITVTNSFDTGDVRAWAFIEKTRAKLQEIFGNEYVHAVGGISALYLDSKNKLYERFPLMIALVSLLIFVALMILFRSILLPLKAIITISSSVLFSYGLIVMVFQWGWGAALIGADVTSEIVYFIPLFLFTTIFGLSMDYSIFLMTRIQEEYQRTGDNTEAVGEGLEKTGLVITAAAIIMVSTFLVFAFSKVLFLKMFGLGLSMAVLIDATLFRTALLPAAMKIAGKWNWWLPGFLKKILPEIKLKH